MPAQLTEELSLRQARHLRRLPQGGLFRHEQTDGQVQRRGLRREPVLKPLRQNQFHGSQARLVDRVEPREFVAFCGWATPDQIKRFDQPLQVGIHPRKTSARSFSASASGSGS